VFGAIIRATRKIPPGDPNHGKTIFPADGDAARDARFLRQTAAKCQSKRGSAGKKDHGRPQTSAFIAAHDRQMVI